MLRTGRPFQDPVFGDLTGAEAGAMWRMLTGTARDLKVELVEHDAPRRTGSRATRSRDRAPVVNDVQAEFRIADGLIAEHVDRFSFWSGRARRWAQRPAARLDAAPARQGRRHGASRARQVHAKEQRAARAQRSARARSGRRGVDELGRGDVLDHVAHRLVDGDLVGVGAARRAAEQDLADLGRASRIQPVSSAQPTGVGSNASRVSTKRPLRASSARGNSPSGGR